MAPDGHDHETRRDLGRADEGKGPEDHCIADLLGAQQRYELEDQAGRSQAVGGVPQCQPPEHRVAQATAHDYAAAQLHHGMVGLGASATRWQKTPVHGRAIEQIERSQNKHGAAPVEHLDQITGQRHIDGASQTDDQGHGDDAAPCLRAESLIDDRHQGLDQTTAHAGAEREPHQEELRQGLDFRPGQQQQPAAERTERHQQAPAVAIDERADGIGHHAGHQQAAGQRGVHRRLRPTKIAMHGRGKQRKAEVHRAPRGHLRQRQRPQHHPRCVAPVPELSNQTAS